MNATKAMEYVDLAIKIAKTAENGSRYFFGGVLVKKNRILNIGINRPHKTHPLSQTRFQAIHCELDTILGVKEEDIEGSSLFIARVGFANRSKIMLSHPCSHCQTLIHRVRIKEVYATTDDNNVMYWDVQEDESWEIEFERVKSVQVISAPRPRSTP